MSALCSSIVGIARRVRSMGASRLTREDLQDSIKGQFMVYR